MNEVNHNPDLIHFMINAGADVDVKDNYGLTPLHYAVLYRKHSIIDILIRAGADINARSCLKRTALHFAISNHQPRLLKRTLPLRGADFDMHMLMKLLEKENLHLNVKDSRGDSPLMWAVMNKQVKAVMELLKKGADPNIRNKDALTALHIALSDEDPCLYIVIPLLFHGANITFADKEGKTPIDILIEKVILTGSYQFAFTCLETIAFKPRIKKHQTQKLQMVPKLWEHLTDCRHEVMLMKLDIIADKLPVVIFMLLGIDDSDFEDVVWKVYYPIVDRLLAGVYPKYSFYILEHISKSRLCPILKITIDAKFCEELDALNREKLIDAENAEGLLDAENAEELLYAKKNQKLPSSLKRERSSIEFFSKIDIFMFSKYLSRLDVFCLTVAFSKGQIHQSMENIRKFNK